jgi:hypothetical protein
MTIATFDLVLVAIVALLTPVALVWTAPNWSVGIQRLRFVATTLRKVLMFVPMAIGVVLVVWGFAAGSKEILYSSILPFIFAYMMSDALRR